MSEHESTVKFKFNLGDWVVPVKPPKPESGSAGGWVVTTTKSMFRLAEPPWVILNRTYVERPSGIGLSYTVRVGQTMTEFLEVELDGYDPNSAVDESHDAITSAFVAIKDKTLPVTPEAKDDA